MEFEISGAGCSDDYGEFFACNTTKIANYSPFQKPLVKSESMTFCFCCLASEAPLVNAERCKHTEFVKLYFQREHSSKLWICCLCHYMLVKIETFRQQIYKSFESRNSKIEQPNKWKLINNLSLKTKISFISLGDDEKPMDLGYEDPLFTAEISVKIENQDCKGFNELFDLDEKSVKTYNESFEPKIDLDSDESMNVSMSTYFDTSTSKRTDKRTKSKSSKGSKSIQTRKRSSRSKKGSKQDSQEVTPVRKAVAKSKIKKSVKKTSSKKKVKSKTEKLHQKQNDEDTSVVIDHNLYKGKIQTIELTREELERERETEREKESWKRKKFKCETCLKGFEYSYVLETHNERHHKILDSKSMMTCDICNCILSNGSSYRPHYKRHFTRYVCMVCGERSEELPAMARHYSTAHADRDARHMEYRCSDCSFTTYTRRIYNYHKRRLHEAKLCTICNKEFTGGISYNFHMKLCHSEPRAAGDARVYRCNACERVYDKKSSCNAHMRAAHGAPALLPYCAACDKHFKHVSSYRYHLKTTLVHNNGVNNYVCDYCGREFRYKPPLRDHIEIQHLNIWNHRCEPCNKTFSSKNLQMKHIQYVHENKQIPKNKICQFCGKGFASRKTLQCHIRRHTGERPLECEFCGDTFAHDAALYTHRKLKHKVPRKRDKKQPEDGQNMIQRDKNAVGEEQNMFQKDKNNLEGQNMFQKDKKQLVNSVEQTQLMFQAQMFNMYSNK